MWNMWNMWNLEDDLSEDQSEAFWSSVHMKTINAKRANDEGWRLAWGLQDLSMAFALCQVQS